MSLTSLFSQADIRSLQLDRSSLKDQSTELLRSYIVGGRIPPGTKLVERELAELLGVSRMPARDALMDLEREGLVISRPNGRYVIDPDRAVVQQLFQVRMALESLAVEQATRNASPENCTALQLSLERMRAAIQRNDRDAYVQSDLAAHQLIWEQAANPYLVKMLNSILGPIFMFISSHTEYQPDWNETLQLHEELTRYICAGQVEHAVQSIRAQLVNSLRLSLQVFDRNESPSGDYRKLASTSNHSATSASTRNND
jgi:DNA-binding GntR family transcriptional regulator